MYQHDQDTEYIHFDTNTGNNDVYMFSNNVNLFAPLVPNSASLSGFPAIFDTGMDSPVRPDSLQTADPFSNTMSAGTFQSDEIRMISPGLNIMKVFVMNYRISHAKDFKLKHINPFKARRINLTFL